MANKEYDVDTIVQDVENAVIAWKYRLASEEEKMLVRIGALENIVRSYKETIAGLVLPKAARAEVDGALPETAPSPRNTLPLRI